MLDFQRCRKTHLLRQMAWHAGRRKYPHSILQMIPNSLRLLRKKWRNFRHNYFDSFGFVHINRTGGTSIEKALGIPFSHRTASEKIAEIGRDRWAKKFTFAIVRNPWDKVVSQYHYRQQIERLGENGGDFKLWLKSTYRVPYPGKGKVPKMLWPQSDWITDKDGVILCNFVGRFESLPSDFTEICGRIRRNATLPHIKGSKHLGYRDYYDEQGIEIVRKRYAKDIQNFGYEF